jgi:glyoxylase-like metal-dependent hydrolase (beta-lactamase superfamily II)
MEKYYKMAEVYVLAIGNHSMNEDKTLDIGSTVTLIKSNKNIVVDTGSFRDQDRIISSLKDHNLTPEDINIVILTHLHLDHTVNTHLFKNAQIMCKFRGGDYPGQMHTPSKGNLQRADLSDGNEIAENVFIMHTPGHTDDMISVRVNTDKGSVVIAGDAIPGKEYMNIEKQPNPVLMDVEEFNKSRKKILEVADYIVPGHGDIFKVEKN